MHSRRRFRPFEQNLKIPQPRGSFRVQLGLWLGFDFLLGQLRTFRFGATPHLQSAPRANSTIDAEAKRWGGKAQFPASFGLSSLDLTCLVSRNRRFRVSGLSFEVVFDAHIAIQFISGGLESRGRERMLYQHRSRADLQSITIQTITTTQVRLQPADGQGHQSDEGCPATDGAAIATGAAIARICATAGCAARNQQVRL